MSLRRVDSARRHDLQSVLASQQAIGERLRGGMRLSEKVLAALKVGPSTTELRELDLPPMPDAAALMKVEVAGVCGTDVSEYRLPLGGGPLVMGHANLGYRSRVGATFAAPKG